MPDKARRIRKAYVRIAAVILLFAMTLCQVSAAVPVLEEDDQINTGMIAQTVKVGGKSRSFKAYIPEGMLKGAYFTVIAPPEDIEAEAFIEEYGWKAYADETREGLLVLEPGKKGKASPDEEMEYIEAVLSDFSENEACSPYGSYYLAGYDKEGSVLQMYAMAHPEMAIGASFIRAFDISDLYMEQMSARTGAAADGAIIDYCIPVLLYDEEDGERTEAVAGYWIGTSQAELVLDNLSTSCRVRTYAGKQGSLSSADIEADIPLSVFTDCSEDFIKAAVAKGHKSVLRKLTRASYFQDGDGRILKRMDADNDCDVFLTSLDGVTQECMVFVPDSVKYSGKLSPVLYLFGNYTEPGNVLLDKLSFWTFAEDKGMIVAVPCTGYIGEDGIRNSSGQDSSASIEEGSYGQLVREICSYVNEKYPVDKQKCMAVIYDEASDRHAPPVNSEATADGAASAGEKEEGICTEYSMAEEILSNLPENTSTIYLSEWSQFPLKYEEAAASLHADTEAVSVDIESEAFITADEEGIRAFVERLYTSFLQREAEEEGLGQWVDILANGKGTASEAVSGFVLSPEFQENPVSTKAYIEALYGIIFQRTPETVELQEWMSVIGMGCTRKKILEGFLNSPEMKELCKGIGIKAGAYYSDELIDRIPDVTAYVSSLYRQILHRNAADTETEAWVRHIHEGYPAARVAEKFFLSRESEWTLFSDFDFVSELYSVAYGKVPDIQAFAAWLRALREGTDREDVVTAVFGEALSVS